MKYELVIFDLDGTLLNTLDDLTDATNRALRDKGFPERTSEEVRRFIGNGAARLIQRALPASADDDLRRETLAGFKRYYSRDINVKTQPYPGIIALLSALTGAGVRVAVNSNKPDSATQALCRAHFDGMIALALGEREGIPKKPAPDGARRIMEALGVPAAATLYVGDGDTDLETARNAGIDSAWVSWGFRRRDELHGLAVPLAFDTADALAEYILK